MNGILIRVPSFTFNSDPIEYCFSTDVNYKKKENHSFLVLNIVLEITMM